jgi:bifunctional non-homologous end joining protein LigD
MATTSYAPDDKLTLSNLTKVFWPESGFTKGDLITYYRAIAEVMVPYLADRPQVLHRHVDGHEGKEFFQRVSRKCPPWMPVVRVSLDHGKKTRDYHLCNDWPHLLWMANFGCVEFIPWNSRMDTLDHPDYMVIDLDPEGVTFADIVETALTVRRLLDRANVPCYCKTSGKRGMHVYVPMARKYHYAHVKTLGEVVAKLVHQELPDITTLDVRPAAREGRIYLDSTRNSRGQACAAPYSARPAHGAMVSAPLKWSEVTKRLSPSAFTIKSMPARLGKLGDLWDGVLGPGVDIIDMLGRLEKQYRPKKSR